MSESLANVNKDEGFQYSETEQWTGKYWIDGKKIYQKTIQDTFSSTTSTWKNMQHNISNIDKIIHYDGYILADNNKFLPLVGMINESPSMWITVIDVLSISTYSNFIRVLGQPMYVTLQYTKTA